jgi:integrase
MGVKKEVDYYWENSKKYGAKVKLYYPSDHKETKDIIYYVTFKIGQEKKKIKVGSKKNKWTEKRAFEQRAKLIDESKFGVGIHSNLITVGELATKYFKMAKIHNRSYIKTEQKYNKHLSYLNNKVVMSLTDDDVSDLQSLLRDKGYMDRYNNDIITILVTIVNHGVKKGIIKYSPLRDVQMIKVDNTEMRFLTMEEIKILFNAVKDNKLFLDFLMISINTGVRITDALSLKKTDVYFDLMQVRLRNTKTGKYYMSPINKPFHEYFFDADDGYLVGGKKRYYYSTFQPSFTKFLNKLFNKGVPIKTPERVKPHTLRHSFATILAMNDVSSLQLKDLLNHGDIKMTERYTHMNVESNRGAIDALGDTLFGKKVYNESE